MLLEDVAASTSAWHELITRQGKACDSRALERVVADSKPTLKRSAAIQEASLHLQAMTVYPLIAASMASCPDLLDQRNSSDAGTASRYDAALASTHYNELLHIVNFSNNTRLQV